MFVRHLATKTRDSLLHLSVACLFIGPISHVHAADSDRRVALVIGIENYRNAPHLPDPIKDGKALAITLRELNFEVTELYDPDFIGLSDGLRHFDADISNSDIVVIYYVGHSIQVNYGNYLLPVDAKLDSGREIFYEAVPLDPILYQASRARKIGFVFLDSARKGPFVERASRTSKSQPGLARMDYVPPKSMIMMSTSPNQVVDDSTGLSPFVSALIANLQVKDINIDTFLRNVHDTVTKATNNRQEPYISSSLGTDQFYFYPKDLIKLSTPSQQPPPSPIAPPIIAPPTPQPTPNLTYAPPIVGGSSRIEVTQLALGIKAPVSPDSSPLIVTIDSLPRGRVQNGAAILRVGDRISPRELAELTYAPEPGLTGTAGVLQYTVTDIHGGVAHSGVQIDIIFKNLSDNQNQTPNSNNNQPPNQAFSPPISPSPPPQPSYNKFQDCPTCPWMISIPGGSYMMGQGARDSEAQPPHRVNIKNFSLGQSPVTVKDWKNCMDAKVCDFLPKMRIASDTTPVHNLSWDDANQYINWLSSISGHQYRLPSESEWEYAVRAGTQDKYWWGSNVGTFMANCTDCGGDQNRSGPLTVDAFQPNPFGLFDMLGGVAEWVADCWFSNYKGAPDNGSPRDLRDCQTRVLRGGSFKSSRDEITVTSRGNYSQSVRYFTNGFRVARD